MLSQAESLAGVQREVASLGDSSLFTRAVACELENGILISKRHSCSRKGPMVCGSETADFFLLCLLVPFLRTDRQTDQS